MEIHDRQLLAATPPCKQISWDSSDLFKMQRLLEQQNHPSALRRTCLTLASRLWVSPNTYFFKGSILGKELDWIPYENTTLGKLRNKLAEVIAPLAAPGPDEFWSFIEMNLELLRKGGTLVLQREGDPKVYLNGDAIENSEVANEWRLMRYQITRLPVDREPPDQISGPFVIQLASGSFAITYKKSKLREEFTFEEKLSEE